MKRELLSNISIRKKLMISCAIISILPVLLITALLTARLYETSVSRRVDASRSNFAQLRENYFNLFEDQVETIDLLLSYQPLWQYLDTPHGKPAEGLESYLDVVAPVLRQYSSGFRQERRSFKIYNDNPTVRFSSEVNNRLEALERSSWYDPTRTDALYHWAPVDDSASRLCCYTDVVRPEAPAEKMVLALFLDEQALHALVSEEAEHMVFLVDDRGVILSSTERELLGAPFDGVPFRTAAHVPAGYAVSYGGKNYIRMEETLTRNDLGIADWKLLYFIPQDDLLADFGQIISSSGLLCLVCLGLSLLLIALVSASITGRLAALTGSIHRIARGDFRTRVQVSGGDEIGRIGRDFNYMAEKIDTLIHTVYEANLRIMESKLAVQTIETEKKEAEILALKGQINPHFLFNTLESIRMNLLLQGDRRTADVMQTFAESIREYLNPESDFVTVREELRFVKKYMSIQRYRFGNRIQLQAYLSEELGALFLPRLILQPLVENAVFHGLEPKEGRGTVVVELAERGGALHLTVTDDGVGMSEEELTRLKAHIAAPGLSPSEGYTKLGLKNVQNRIRLLYGADYGMQIWSKQGRGTEIEVTLPVIRTRPGPDRKEGF